MIFCGYCMEEWTEGHDCLQGLHRIETLCFTNKEVRALARVLEREWITHDDEEVQKVVNKIFDFTAKDDDMARGNS